MFEFDALGFAESKKADSFAIYEGYLSEIDDYPDLFQSEQFSKHVHVLNVNPATHAQHDSVISTDCTPCWPRSRIGWRALTWM